MKAIASLSCLQYVKFCDKYWVLEAWCITIGMKLKRSSIE